MRAICSSSGGKDSLLAIWHAARNGFTPGAMLTMLDESGKRNRSHGVPLSLLRLQAEAMGLELVAPSASWSDYEKVFVSTLRELRKQGWEAVIFGDIDLQPHRDWEERVCRAADLQPCLPLWQRDRRELAAEALALGFRAIVVCVDSRFLPDEFCGREFDARFLEDLPEHVDPCGENGEFHTFVYAGPLFSRALDVRVAGTEAYVTTPASQRYCFAKLEAA